MMAVTMVREEQSYPAEILSITSASASSIPPGVSPGMENLRVSESSGRLSNDTAAATGQLSPPYATSQGPVELLAAPSMPLDRFEAYVKDTLGSYAPSFQKQQQRNPMNEHQGGSGLDSHTSWGGQGHHGSAVRPIDVNMYIRSTLDLEKQVTQLDSADMEYLKAKGVFDLPPRKLQEDLVEVFFSDVHPTAPVINRAEFLSSFYSHGQPSRLLLFAIFTSASRACRNPALLDKRGTNQGSALRFYKATRVSMPNFP